MGEKKKIIDPTHQTKPSSFFIKTVSFETVVL